MRQKRLPRYGDFNASRFCRSLAQPETYSVPSPLRSRPRGGSIGIVCKIYGLQALQHGFGLLTRNRRDFEDIAGLDLTL